MFINKVPGAGRERCMSRSLRDRTSPQRLQSTRSADSSAGWQQLLATAMHYNGCDSPHGAAAGLTAGLQWAAATGSACRRGGLAGSLVSPAAGKECSDYGLPSLFA